MGVNVGQPLKANENDLSHDEMVERHKILDEDSDNERNMGHTQTEYDRYKADMAEIYSILDSDDDEKSGGSSKVEDSLISSINAISFNDSQIKVRFHFTFHFHYLFPSFISTFLVAFCAVPLSPSVFHLISLNYFSLQFRIP